MILVAAAAAVSQDMPIASGPVVVLDTSGFWRMYHTLKQPVVDLDSGVVPITLGKRWVEQGTADAPTGWTKPDFDDSAWLRSPARASILSPLLARCCMRGKFTVTDPAKVGDLRLSVTYHGGAVVYVNGLEVARKHLPSGALAADVLAEGYPEEAYLTPKGTWLQAYEARGKTGAELARRLALRERTLSDVAIPGKLLRRGMNVIAIEIVRAPYHKVVEERKNEAKARRRGTPYVLCLNTCEFTLVQVTSKSVAGLEQ